jgi:hypothetical protein
MHEPIYRHQIESFVTEDGAFQLEKAHEIVSQFFPCVPKHRT